MYFIIVTRIWLDFCRNQNSNVKLVIWPEVFNEYLRYLGSQLAAAAALCENLSLTKPHL